MEVTMLLKLRKDCFHMLTEELRTWLSYAYTRKVLRATHLFDDMEDETFEEIVKCCKERRYLAGTDVVQQGDLQEHFFIVKEGMLSVWTAEDHERYTKLKIQSARMMASSAGLMSMEIAPKGQVVHEQARVISDNGHSLVNGNGHSLVNGQEHIVNGNGQVANGRSSRKDRVSRDTVISGEDALIDDEVEFGELSVADHFGAAAIPTGKPRKTSVSALTDSVLLCLDKERFNHLFTGVKHMLRLEGQRWVWFVSNKPMRDCTVTDLKVGHTLGEGTFGRVKLVIHSSTQTVYVLKSMRKAMIVLWHQMTHVANERRLLASLDHPFINRLAASFQDASVVYMMLEPLMGGELTSVIEREGKLDENVTRFYSACVASALAYLHVLRIAYRDLKPENLVLDGSGYVKIVDLGFAKVVVNRTFTFCGTPEFIAPEIIANRGHSLAVDWWAFGILVYTMLVGRTPFLPEEAMRPDRAQPMSEYDMIYAIYRRAMRRDGHTLSFPLHVLPTSRSLITELLEIDQTKRLGTERASEVMNHSFFQPWGCGLIQGIDFKTLHRRQYPAPFVPQSTAWTDATIKPDAEPEPALPLNGYAGTEGELIKGMAFPDF